MAAFLGHARQWEIFGRRLRALQRRDGFSIFHASGSRANRANSQIGLITNA